MIKNGSVMKKMSFTREVAKVLIVLVSVMLLSSCMLNDENVELTEEEKHNILSVDAKYEFRFDATMFESMYDTEDLNLASVGVLKYTETTFREEGRAVLNGYTTVELSKHGDSMSDLYDYDELYIIILEDVNDNRDSSGIFCSSLNETLLEDAVQYTFTLDGDEIVFESLDEVQMIEEAVRTTLLEYDFFNAMIPYYIDYVSNTSDVNLLIIDVFLRNLEELPSGMRYSFEKHLLTSLNQDNTE